MLTVVLRQGCDAALFECVSVEESAQTIITCLSGLNPTNLSPQELGERDEIEGRTHRIIDLVLKGLLVRKGQM